MMTTTFNADEMACVIYALRTLRGTTLIKAEDARADGDLRRAGAYEHQSRYADILIGKIVGEGNE